MPKTILFVEDSEVEFAAYSMALRKAGYTVIAARDGLEALRYLNNQAPDVVLLDLVLPKFDGVEVLKFMRKNNHTREVPVIIFSTNSIICSDDEPLLERAARRLLKVKCTPRLLLQEVWQILGDESAEPATV